MKETTMSDLVESLGYIKCHNWCRPSLLRAQAVLSNAVPRRFEVESEDIKPYWKSGKEHISQDYQQTRYLQVFQKFYWITRWKLLAVDHSPAFWNTDTTDQTFQQYGK